MPTLRTSVHFYRAEARFLRALSYSHGIDLFGNIRCDRKRSIGLLPPAQATRARCTPTWLSELNESSRSCRTRSQYYGRATADAAHMLLANLYLNARYIGNANYSGALTEAQIVISRVRLHDRHQLCRILRNFQADTILALRDSIFVAAQDGEPNPDLGWHDVLTHAGCGGRCRPRLWDRLLRGAVPDEAEDVQPLCSGRPAALDLLHDWTAITVDTIEQFSNGLRSQVTNIKSAGGGGAQSGCGYRLPHLQIAEAYLIYTEANLRWRRECD